MLFTQKLRARVKSVEVTANVRIWNTPHVKVGGHYRLDQGHIEVTSIRQIRWEDLSDKLARDTGFTNLVDLMKTAKHGTGQRIYRFTMRIIFIILGLAAFIYVALCLTLFLSQPSFIYYPQPKPTADSSPTLTLNMDGERILVSTRPEPGPAALIYFGGNAEDVSRSLPTMANVFPDRSLYALNYRGYGGSTGKPSEAALIADALVLFDHVHVDHSHIILIGRSLGSGVAVHVASERPVERLVLVTPYDSLLNIAARQFPLLPIRWLLLDKFESWRYAPKVRAPTQLIAAQNDEVIPFVSTEALYKHFPEGSATLTVIHSAGHNSISESLDYLPLLAGTYRRPLPEIPKQRSQ